MNAVSFNDALLETAKYTGVSNNLFSKAIKGFAKDDIVEMIMLFNHFASNMNNEITEVFKIEDLIFDSTRDKIY